MKKIILDFMDCRYILRLYEIIQEGFGFPDWFGKNLDALWDLLRYYDGAPILVQIKGIETMPKELRKHMDEVLKVFNEVHQEVPQLRFEVLS